MVTIGKSKSFNSLPGLTPLEKRSVFLVLLGTLLEYFDLVLYVHLAVVLNPLFFPTSDPWVAGLLGVFTFAAAYLLRPIGAFVFGYVGDKIGRKASIIWTSGLMGFAALTIACLPVYNTIGWAASLFFILARALQGFSAIGEFIGAQVFLSEVSEKSRMRHFLSTLPIIATFIGSLLALGVATLFIHIDPNNGWRWPYVCGSIVALVGGIIRLKAIESPAFLKVQEQKKDPTIPETLAFFQALAFRKKNYWYFFGMSSLAPLSFYFSMRYCSDLLKSVGLSPTDVIQHNLGVVLLQLLVVVFYGWLTLFYEPFKILKTKLVVGLCALPLLLTALSAFPNESVIFAVQVLSFSLLAAPTPAQFKVIQAFPVIGRCTNLGSAYAISHALMYVITSSFVFFLDQMWGLWGVGALFMVTTAVAIFCASQFTPEEKLPSFEYAREELHLA